MLVPQRAAQRQHSVAGAPVGLRNLLLLVRAGHRQRRLRRSELGFSLRVRLRVQREGQISDAGPRWSEQRPASSLSLRSVGIFRVRSGSTSVHREVHRPVPYAT